MFTKEILVRNKASQSHSGGGTPRTAIVFTVRDMAERPVTLEDVLVANIRAERSRRRWRQRDLAARMGVAEQTISEIERGIRAPRVNELAVLCRVFDVPLRELFHRAEAADLQALFEER